MLPRHPPPPPPPLRLHCPPRLPSRSRPTRRQKNTGIKKQPQRGLGVAQLEKLRLEEQIKQQDASCIPPLRHHLSPLSDASFFTHGHDPQVCLLKAGPFHVISTPLHGTEIELPDQPVGVALAPWTKLDYCQNEGRPLLAYTSLELSAVPLSVGMVTESEPFLSSLSQLYDSCSTRAMSCNISLTEQLAEQLIPDNAKGLNVFHKSPTFIPHFLMTEGKAGSWLTQSKETGKKPCNSQRGLEQLSPVKPSQLQGPRVAQYQGGGLLSTDLCLLDLSLGQLANTNIQPRNSDEASMTVVSPIDAGSLELSSFQNVISSDPGWSLSEQVSGRKRPRIFGQETIDLEAMLLNPLARPRQPNGLSLDTVESSVPLRIPKTIYGVSTVTETSDEFRATILENLENGFPANRTPSSIPLPGQLRLLSLGTRKDYWSRMPSEVSSPVSCGEESDQTFKVDSNDCLTLGISSSLWRVREPSRLIGEYDLASSNIGQVEEAHLYHGDNEDARKAKGKSPWNEELNIPVSPTRHMERNTVPVSPTRHMERNTVPQEQQKGKVLVDLNLKLSL